MAATVLVVEDERKLRDLVRSYLERAGFTVLSTDSGAEAITMAMASVPDLVILDLGLPDVPGETVARELRETGPTSGTPILMLTAKTAEEDRIRGLELGADDYVTKPFSPKELVARVRAVLRRTEALQRPADEIVRAGDVTLDAARMRVEVDGRRVDLTPTEFDLLATLARQPGRVFTRAQLLDAIHGVAFESYERAIDAHVKNIRHKIEADPRSPRYLQTVFGVGYRFADDGD